MAGRVNEQEHVARVQMHLDGTGVQSDDASPIPHDPARRLRQRLLATTRASVLDVALESGFASISRFYAAFTAQTGNPPRRFRYQLAAARRA